MGLNCAAQPPAQTEFRNPSRHIAGQHNRIAPKHDENPCNYAVFGVLQQHRNIGATLARDYPRNRKPIPFAPSP